MLRHSLTWPTKVSSRRYQVLGFCVLILFPPVYTGVVGPYITRASDFVLDGRWAGFASGTIGGVITSLYLLAVYSLFRQARRVGAALRKEAGESASPVLYLRSFKEDKTLARLLGFRTIEEQLASAVMDIGPFIAVGSPGEALPEVGAKRIYISQDAWQQEVIRLAAKSRLVIIGLGEILSDGLRWELREIVTRLEPERIVLFLDCPSSKFRKLLNEVSSILCKEIIVTRFPFFEVRFFRVRGFVIFSNDWKADFKLLRSARHTLFLSGDTFRFRVTRPLELAIKLSLRPTYQALGLTWHKPSLALAGVCFRLPVICTYFLIIAMGAISLYYDYSSGEASIRKNMNEANLAYFEETFGLPEAEYLKWLDPWERERQVAQVTAAGLLALDDNDLLQRALLLRLMLRRLDLPRCAELSLGRFENVNFEYILSNEELNLWAQISLKALRAGLRQEPRRTFSRKDADAAAVRLIKVDGEKYGRAFRNLPTISKLSHEEACLYTRVVYDAFDDLSEPERFTWARVLASPP